jgi:hypothetical protein
VNKNDLKINDIIFTEVKKHFKTMRYELIKTNRESYVPINELLNNLLELQKENPHALIVVTEHGYYSGGDIATIASKPIKIGDNLYTIGHSWQTY